MPKKRGEVAREKVKDTIINAFKATNNFVAFQDKKIYVTANDDDGELIQFAITLTMPKTPIQTEEKEKKEEAAATDVQTEISQEDKQQIEHLKKMLGII